MKTYRIQEQGFVLITALMLLIVMTILGVSAISSVTKQERMASNLREKSKAFEAAGFAMREGEVVLKDMLDYPGVGYITTGQLIDLNASCTSAVDPEQKCLVAQNPQYGLEELDSKSVIGGSLTPSTQVGTRSQAKAFYYGVESEGWGGNTAAYSRQMSVYARIY